MVAMYCGYVVLNAANPRILAALERRAAARKTATRPSLPSRHGPAASHMADSAMVRQRLPRKIVAFRFFGGC